MLERTMLLMARVSGRIESSLFSPFNNNSRLEGSVMGQPLAIMSNRIRWVFDG